MIVWLCVRWENEHEINGIFSTEEKAVNRCKDRFDYIVPLTLDEEQPEELCAMIGQYYPHGETREEGAIRCEASQKDIDDKEATCSDNLK